MCATADKPFNANDLRPPIDPSDPAQAAQWRWSADVAAFERDGGKRINISQIAKALNPDSQVSMRSHTLDGPVAAQHASDTDISRDRSRSCIRAVEFKTIRPAESSASTVTPTAIYNAPSGSGD